MGFQLNNPSSGAGAGTIDVLGNGVMTNNHGAYLARQFTYAPPLYIENPDGIADAPHFTVRPSWFPCVDMDDAWIDADVAAETVIPFLGADEFIIETIRVSDFSGASDSTFRFVAWTGPGLTGTQLITSSNVTGVNMWDVQKFDAALPWKGRPSALYVTVTVANPTPLKFRIAPFTMAWLPIFV